MRILEYRDYVVILDVKADDPTLLRAEGYKRITRWPPDYGDVRVRLAPPVRKKEDLPRQKRIMRECLDTVFRDGAWTVYVDEVRVVTDPRYMGLQSDMETLWLFGRSRHLTVVATSQKPVYIPRAAYDQATHIYLFKIQDEQALKRLGEVGGDTKRIQAVVRGLDRHEFCYVDTARDRLLVSAVELARPGK